MMGRFVKKLLKGLKRIAVSDNAGMGVIEIILIIVVIFTIYKGCK